MQLTIIFIFLVLFFNKCYLAMITLGISLGTFYCFKNINLEK